MRRKNQKNFGINFGSVMKVAQLGQQALGAYQQSQDSYQRAREAESASAESQRQTRELKRLSEEVGKSKNSGELTQQVGSVLSQKGMSMTQRNYALPAILGAVATSVLPMAVQPAMNFITGDKSQGELQEQSIRAQNAQTEATKRLAAASERAQARQKQMSAAGDPGFLKNLGGLAKDIGKVGFGMIKNNKKAFYGAAAAGATAAGIKYGVNKFIQRDMKKNNISMNQIAGNRNRQMYLANGATPGQIEQFESQKSYSLRSILPFSTVASTAISEAPNIAGYMGQRKQILQQRKMQEKIDRLNKQKSNLQQQQPQQQSVLQKSYSYSASSILRSAFDTFKGQNKSGVGLGKRAAIWGNKAMNFGAELMGGGKGIVKTTGKFLQNQGAQSGNKWTQNAGNWIMANQKKALIGSLGVGALMAKGVAQAGKLGYKATDKALRTVDRNAYTYTDTMSGQVNNN